MQINVKQAFLQSDIKWENIQKNRKYAYFKRISLFILLVLFSVLILSPINAISTLEPMRIALEKIVSKLSFAQQLLRTYFSDWISIFINFVIIPFLIDLCTQHEDYLKESSKQVSIMKKIYFFMLLNTLLIPITSTSTAQFFFEKLGKTDIDEWPNLVSTNMMTQQFTYIKFII